MRYLLTVALILGLGVLLLYKLEDYRTSKALAQLQKSFGKYQMSRLRKQIGVYLQSQGSSAVSPLFRILRERREGLDRRLLAQALLCRLAEGPWLKGAARGRCLAGCFEEVFVAYRDQDEVGLLQKLKSGSPGEMRYAATGFTQNPKWIQSEVQGALQESLQSSYLPLRVAALEALAEVGDAKIVPIAKELLGKDSRLTSRLLRALGKIQGGSSESVLVAAFEKYPVRVLKALAGRQGGWTETLQASLSSRDPRVRAYAARAYTKSGHPKGIPSMAEGLRTAGEARSEFLEAAVGLEEPALLPLLVALAADKDPEIRAATADSLVPWRDPLAQASVNSMLVDKDLIVVRAAVRVLAKHADVRDGGRLAKFLGSTDRAIRYGVFRGLTRMRDVRVLPEMRTVLEGRSARSDAEEVLLAEHGVAVLEGRIENTDPPTLEDQVILRLIEG